MKEVMDHIYVGSQADDEALTDRHGWAIVHAAKEPYHRRAVGYTNRAAPADHPERLIALRGNELYLNLIDAPDAAYLPVEIFDAARGFIYGWRAIGAKVLIHCNQGLSRAPGIAMYYMIGMLPSVFDDAVEAFTELYPEIKLGDGVAGRLREEWNRAQT